MSKLGSIVIAMTLGGGAVACLVPSFEGMSGGTADASPTDPPADGGDAGATTRDAGAATDTGSATNDALEAGSRTFQCRPDKGSERCVLGSQRCCYNAGPTWQCVSKNDSSTFCLGVSTCGDDSDCQAGETCCFDITEAACTKGPCPSTGYRTCDKMRADSATCGGGLTCTYPHFNYEPPRCL